MEDAISLYEENKLLVRAMDWPQLSRGEEGIQYDCTTFANEFCMLMRGSLYSASSTLIIPEVGIHTYKNIGFLINSDKADCHHIAKSDSVSRGNVQSGDFEANEPDFETIKELAEYIIKNNSIDLNEVNINASIDSIVGLFFVECPNQEKLLQMIYLAKRCIKSMTGIDFPIYSYNAKEGKISKVELSQEEEQQLIDSLRTTKILYWPDEYDEPVIEDIRTTKPHIK